MWTPTHALITAFLAYRLRRRWSIEMGPALAGAVMPDVPLVVLTLGYAALRRLTGVAGAGEGLYAPGFDNLFFRDPVWVTLHNGLHAPLVLAALGLFGWVASHRGRRWGRSLGWFVAACGLHTVMDALTHTHDGPLLLFPLDWTYRFASPVSYWHPANFGREWTRIEWFVDGVIAAYFVLWWRGRRGAAARGRQP